MNDKDEILKLIRVTLNQIPVDSDDTELVDKLYHLSMQIT